MQIAANGEPADDAVAEDRQQDDDRRHPQAPSHRTHPERPDRHDQCGDADETAHEPVDLLDRRMSAGDVDETLVVAVRPVITAEAAAGEANDRAGDRQEAHTGHRDDGELPESPQ